MAHCRAQRAVGPLQKEGSREAEGASKSCTLQGRAVGPYASDIPTLGLRVARVLPGLGSPMGWGHWEPENGVFPNGARTGVVIPAGTWV